MEKIKPGGPLFKKYRSLVFSNQNHILGRGSIVVGKEVHVEWVGPL